MSELGRARRAAHEFVTLTEDQAHLLCRIFRLIREDGVGWEDAFRRAGEEGSILFMKFVTLKGTDMEAEEFFDATFDASVEFWSLPESVPLAERLRVVGLIKGSGEGA